MKPPRSGENSPRKIWIGIVRATSQLTGQSESRGRRGALTFVRVASSLDPQSRSKRRTLMSLELHRNRHHLADVQATVRSGPFNPPPLTLQASPWILARRISRRHLPQEDW